MILLHEPNLVELIPPSFIDFIPRLNDGNRTIHTRTKIPDESELSGELMTNGLRELAD